MNKTLQALCVLCAVIILGNFLYVAPNIETYVSATAYTHRTGLLERSGVNDGWNNIKHLKPEDRKGYENPPSGIFLKKRTSSLPAYQYKPCSLGTHCAGL